MSTFLPNSSTSPAPEPGPAWQVAWSLHWCGLGIAFALMALNSIAALAFVDKTKTFARKPFFVAVNSFLIFLGVTRTLYLWIDPYESGQNIAKCPPWLVRSIFGIAFPCLTSAFCLIHLAFLESAKIQVGPLGIQSTPYVVTIIAIHFAIVIVVDNTVAFKATTTELLMVCQSPFVGWGFLNSVAFLYRGTRIIRKIKETQRELQTIQGNGNQANASQDRDNTSKVTKINMITSVLGCACCALQLYSVVGVYGSYSKVMKPEPWPWWAFQTSFRLVELAMGWAIAYSVLQPSQHGRQSLLWFTRCRRERVGNLAGGSLSLHLPRNGQQPSSNWSRKGADKSSPHPTGS